MKMKNFILIILVAFAFGLSLSRNYRLTQQVNRYKTQTDTLQYQLDSLNGEISTRDIDLGRYEIIMDRMRELDSPLVEKATKNLE